MDKSEQKNIPKRIFNFNLNFSQISFPKEPYALQTRMMKTIIQAISQKKSLIVQSPTGTGKTLCLLSSTIEAIKQNGIKKIYYLTRTHSQMTGIIKEIKSTCYQPKYTFLQSIKSLCVHKQVNEKGSSLDIQQFNGLCELARSSKQTDRQVISQCYYQTKLALNPQSKNSQSTQYKKISFPQFKSIQCQDDIKKYSKKQGNCPYYYVKALEQPSELVVMSYNYLLNPFIFAVKKFDLSNSVIIFDEAHNILDLVKQLNSTSLVGNQIEVAQSEINNIRYCQFKNQTQQQQYFNLLHQMQEYIKQSNSFYKDLKEYYYKNKDPKKNAAIIIYLSELKKVVKCSEFSGIRSFIQTNQSSLANFWLKVSEIKKNNFQDNGRRGKTKKSRVKTIINVIYMLNLILSNDENQKHYVCALLEQYNTKKKQTIFMIKFHCLTSKFAFTKLQMCKTIIFASGTIRKQQFIQDTGLNFLNSFCLQLPKQNPYSNQNIQTFELQFFNGSTLNITNQHPNYKQVVGWLSQLLLEIPHGVLVFFKSGSYMKEFKQYIQKHKIPMGKKKIFYQLRKGKEFDQDYMNYKIQSQQTNGAVFFSYMRGKISEGCNFNDHLARAVFIVGLPLASLGSAEVRIKKFVSKNQAEFQKWYNRHAMLAVNQGIGRVLRHKNDYGLVYLLGKKLCCNRKMLPSWLLTNPVHNKSGLGFVKNMTQKFFRNKQNAIVKLQDNQIIIQQNQFQESQDSSEQFNQQSFIQNHQKHDILKKPTQQCSNNKQTIKSQVLSQQDQQQLQLLLKMQNEAQHKQTQIKQNQFIPSQILSSEDQQQLQKLNQKKKQAKEKQDQLKEIQQLYQQLQQRKLLQKQQK